MKFINSWYILWGVGPHVTCLRPSLNIENCCVRSSMHVVNKTQTNFACAINANMHTICIYTCTRIIVNGTKDMTVVGGFQGCRNETFLHFCSLANYMRWYPEWLCSVKISILVPILGINCSFSFFCLLWGNVDLC